MDEPIFRYSRIVDPQEVKRACFTTLPVRIHIRNDIVNKETRRFDTEWAEAIEDGFHFLSKSSYSEKENFSSFGYPEAHPETIGLLSYLTECSLVHDGLYHALSLDSRADVC